MCTQCVKLLGAKGSLVRVFCLLLARYAVKFASHLQGKSKKKNEGDLVLVFTSFG